MAGQMIIDGEIVIPVLDLSYGVLEKFLDYIISGTYETLPTDLETIGTTLENIIGGNNV